MLRAATAALAGPIACLDRTRARDDLVVDLSARVVSGALDQVGRSKRIGTISSTIPYIPILDALG